MFSALLFVFVAFLEISNAQRLCEKICTCEENTPEDGLQTMDCSRVDLTIVPQVDMWANGTTILDLSGNKIQILDVELNHSNLVILKLNSNKIKTVVPSSFGGLSNLKYLDLSNNDIEEIEGKTFYGLEKLEVLNISHNRLKTIPDNVFYNLFELEELSLSNNPIVHLEPAHFNRVLNLKTLDLSNIGAYSFAPNLFLTLEHLKLLDISANDFHTVPTEALRSAKSLKWLRLNGNPIDKLDKKSFVRLKTLEVLELNYMDLLESVDSQTFSELTNLTVLEMKYNKKLNSIDKDAFKNIFDTKSKPILQEINLERNLLSTLDAIPCSKMRKVNLQRNPWTCDCRMKWIKRCQIQAIYAADLMCKYPGNLRDTLVVNIPEEDFKCVVMSGAAVEELHHNRVVRTLSLVFGFVLLITLAAGIVLVLKWRSIRGWWKSRRRGPGAVYYVRAQNNPQNM